MNLIGIDLDSMGTVALRKLAAQAGIKGQSSARGAFIRDILRPIQNDQIAAEAAKSTPAAVKASKGKCTECGRKEDFRASELCKECREYGEWENAHADEGHGDQEFPVRDELTDACQVCHPELDGRKARRAGRSRVGMVIIAKGTEMHKSMTFKKAAEAAGWIVDLTREFYELGEDATGEGTRHYATAIKGENSISLAWDGRAYDYPASSARIGGKDRKVRNLKEALRLL